MSNDFTKYERARIIGARALQISMDAPILLKMKKEELEALNYDPLKIAEKELDSGSLPISVERPMPIKTESKIKKLKKEALLKDSENEEVKEEDIPEELINEVSEDEDSLSSESSGEYE